MSPATPEQPGQHRHVVGQPVLPIREQVIDPPVPVEFVYGNPPEGRQLPDLVVGLLR